MTTNQVSLKSNGLILNPFRLMQSSC